MDKELKKAVNSVHSEAFQESLRITTDALRYLLTLSVSLLTLLVPLLIYAIGRTQIRYPFFAVVLSLLFSSLASLSGLIIHVHKFQLRENYARQIAEYSRGEGNYPEKTWKSPHELVSTLAIISGISFGIASITLCLILFQILFS